MTAEVLAQARPRPLASCQDVAEYSCTAVVPLLEVPVQDFTSHRDVDAVLGPSAVRSVPIILVII